MTQTLAQLIASLQVMLIDDGTRFTTATCTAAIREALKEFNLFAPVNAADLITVEANLLEYELSDADERALFITGVWLKDADANGDEDVELKFDQYNEDERIFFRLRDAQTTGRDLLVRYTIPQTVSGLDSQTESTLSALYDQILLGGAKAEAMQMRADSRIETINLQAGVSDNYREQIQSIKSKFNADLKAISKTRRPGVGVPNNFAWNDEWHGWNV